jgi:hypothetical protein
MRSILPALAVILALARPSAAGDAPEPLLKDFMGLNGHFTFRPALYRPTCRLVRNYHNMDWDVAKPGDKPTFPMCVNRVDWKLLYGAWRKEGFEVDVCAQFGGFGGGNPNYRKLWEGNEAWARTYGLEMARCLGPSGAEKLCTSIEIGNEPGRKFDDALYQKVFRAMAEGIREGDPKVKIVTCTAQAREADDYAKSLDETFAAPDLVKLFDVINVHTYAMKAKAPGQSPWDRSYPEDPAIDYLSVVDEVRDWRDRKAPGKAIWITEFGWDACTEAVMAKRTGWFKKLNWTGVTDLQQAQYLVRSFFLFAERPVDRAYLYYYDDNDEPAFHAAAGLTRKFQPKPSYWAVRHLQATLGEYRFGRVVRRDAGDVCVYEFANGADPALKAWAAWSPTGSGREQEVTIQGLPRNPLKVERMPTADGEAPAVEWKEAGPKAVRLTVTESPAYILMGK